MLTNNYISEQNLPQKAVKRVLVDCKVPKDAIKSLENRGVEVLLSKELKTLNPAINSHPDMQFHHLYDNVCVCEPTLYDYYRNLLKDFKIIKGKSKLLADYPKDISYNAFKIGNYFFHNLKCTDLVLGEYYKSQGVKLINVKQGYTKCSTALIFDNAAITSDIGIYNSLINCGIDSLLVGASNINLKGMSCGLFGGICGKISKKELAVFGSIKTLINHHEIIDFCNKYNVEIIELMDGVCQDFGSIIPLSY